MEKLNTLFNDYFNIGFNSKGLKSIVNPSDVNAMDFILQDDNNYINYEKVFREIGQFNLLYSINGKINTFDSKSISKFILLGSIDISFFPSLRPTLLLILITLIG